MDKLFLLENGPDEVERYANPSLRTVSGSRVRSGRPATVFGVDRGKPVRVDNEEAEKGAWCIGADIRDDEGRLGCQVFRFRALGPPGPGVGGNGEGDILGQSVTNRQATGGLRGAFVQRMASGRQEG